MERHGRFPHEVGSPPSDSSSALQTLPQACESEDLPSNFPQGICQTDFFFFFLHSTTRKRLRNAYIFMPLNILTN